MEKNLEQVDSENVLETQAKDFLRGKELSPKQVIDLSKKLRKYKSFTYARRILKRASNDSQLARDKKLRLHLFQQWSLCTYKDDDLPIDLRLNEAHDILTQVEDISTTTNQETLGLIGAIYKRRWEVDNQKMQLERALLYYMRGYNEGAENDQGYTGINAAFVLDWLAFQEEAEARSANVESLVAKGRRKKANEIRTDIIEKVTPLTENASTALLRDSWWYYSTLAEANFGLQQYEKAVQCLTEARAIIGEIPEWEEESTIQQLARLAIFQADPAFAGKEFEGTPAWNALSKVFGNRLAAVHTAFTGRIGLALSGGGFRASLFHIGTLARLAELDVLRHVEVLSCVSGGSIVGAHYYLKVRELLQSKSDMKSSAEQNESRDEDSANFVTKQDYIRIVREMVKEFLDGVQQNVRVRIAAEFTTNLKMMFSPKYSRTIRAGELYEEQIFSKVYPRDDSPVSKSLFLNELNVYPKDDVVNFNPKLHNWRRAAKVPILVLNATTLNTGHNWQFTTRWMGEPPSNITTEIDTNDRLRRMYHKEAPPKHRKIRLGHAVAASACVPGIFEPLTLEELYPERTVGLVDGGVCDNQGVSGLLEQDCTVVLVSDGSGQMASQKKSSSGILGVPLRSNSILQARIRNAQYHDLERRRRSSLLRGLMFIHLKEDLDSEQIDWVGCLDPLDRPERGGILTRYGIAKEIQQQLAAIRTDLDSFSDLEAYALMTSAYRMTENAFGNLKCVDGFSDDGEVLDWEFLKAEEGMKGAGPKFQHLTQLLSVSDDLAFKVWKQSLPLRAVALFLGLIATISMVWLLIHFCNLVLIPPVTVGHVAIMLLGLVVTLGGSFLLGKTIIRGVRWRNTLARVGFGICMCTLGWIVARIHLWIFDKIFLRFGSIDSFLSTDKK